MMSDSENELLIHNEDELELDQDDLSEIDYDLHYCESHDSYYCDEIDNCNPQNQCFPAMNHCKAYRRLNICSIVV